MKSKLTISICKHFVGAGAGGRRLCRMGNYQPECS